MHIFSDTPLRLYTGLRQAEYHETKVRAWQEKQEAESVALRQLSSHTHISPSLSLYLFIFNFLNTKNISVLEYIAN